MRMYITNATVKHLRLKVYKNYKKSKVWEYLKDKIYATKSETITEIKVPIEQAWSQIPIEI